MRRDRPFGARQNINIILIWYVVKVANGASSSSAIVLTPLCTLQFGEVEMGVNTISSFMFPSR